MEFSKPFIFLFETGKKKNRIPCVQNSTKLYAWKRDSIGEISYVDLLLLNHSPLVSDARMAKENPPDVPQLLTVCDICSMVEDIAGNSVTIAIYRARVASAFFLPFLRRMCYVPFQHAKDELYNLLSAHVRKRTSNMRTGGKNAYERIAWNEIYWNDTGNQQRFIYKGRMLSLMYTLYIYLKKKKKREERQLPLGADPSSGEQTFHRVLYTHSSSYHLSDSGVGLLREMKKKKEQAKTEEDRASLNVKRISQTMFF